MMKSREACDGAYELYLFDDKNVYIVPQPINMHSVQF